MNLKEINRKLRDLYGSIVEGKQTFRIVWSDDQYEDRFGEYEDYYGHIFLRSFKGVRRVKKYQEDPPSYVLERLLPNSVPNEILDSFVTYEPLYFFKDDQGEQLPLAWRAIELMMWVILYGPKKAVERVALGTKERDKKEYIHAMEMFENESPYIAGMLQDRTAVVNAWGQPYYGGVR